MGEQRKQTSVDFQVLVVGTVLFLGVFFWCTMPEHSPTGQVINEQLSIIYGLSTIAVYLAFVVLIAGHALLKGHGRPPEKSD